MPSSDRLERLKARARAFLLKVGAVQTFLVLNVLYVVVGAPVALAMKLLGHDPTGPGGDDGSYWHDRRERERTLDDFTRQF